MKGSELRKQYELSGLRAEDFASKMEVSRTYLYRLFDQEELEPFYVNKSKSLHLNTPIGIPLISTEAMEKFGKASFAKVITNAKYYSVPEFFEKKADYIVQLTDDSMAPKYYKNDLLACKQLAKDSFIQPGKIYLLNTKQGGLCKRLFEAKKKDYVNVVSENEVYPAFDIAREEIKSLALIIGLIRIE